MEKYKFSQLTKTFWAFNAGMWLMIGLHSCSDDSAERITDVQEHNAGLQAELEPDFPGMGRLVLNDETDTFEFHVQGEGQPEQSCSGEYQVTEKVAHVSGDIACTTTIVLEG